MKFLDVMIFLFVFSIFCVLFSGELNLYFELVNKNNEYIEKKTEYEFISTSFRNSCQGKGFKSLYQWQKVCKDLFNLEYIGWSNADEFMILSDEIKNPVLYGNWRSKEHEGEVYWMEGE